jgi:hypothetical protein
MKALFFEFLLYVYVNFIKEDWDVLTDWGKRYYFIPWFVRSVIIWVICPIFIVPFLIQRSEAWKEFRTSMDEYMKSVENK